MCGERSQVTSILFDANSALCNIARTVSNLSENLVRDPVLICVTLGIGTARVETYSASNRQERHMATFSARRSFLAIQMLARQVILLRRQGDEVRVR